MTSRLRVIKVGGSLFEYASLPTELGRWLAAQPAALNVLVPGGGPWAEAVRRVDQTHGIGAERGHWICVQLLDVTAQLLAYMLPSAPLVESCAELSRLAASGATGHRILMVQEFLRHEEPKCEGTPLSHDWRTTADAIAARVAVGLQADELVLLKSCDLPPAATMRDAVELGSIDEILPLVARQLHVRWVNLRSADWTQTAVPH